MDLRPADYASKYDWSTLWYDACFDPTGTYVVINGPPLFNLAARLTEASSAFYRGHRPLAVHSQPLTNLHEFWLDLEGHPEGYLSLQGNGYTIPIAVEESGCSWFEGLRCIYTVSKDNDLLWIRDWLQIHVELHGTEAVLIYDNGSTMYSAQELLDTIGSIPGLKVAVVVKWPFCYGPGGNEKLPWDSTYCQPGALQHGRWRFLAGAKSVIQCDIDEVVVRQNSASVHELCEQATSGYLEFPGTWCFPSKLAAQDRLMRHADHTWRQPKKGGCSTKWAVVPDKIPAEAQWEVHSIVQFRGMRMAEVEYRHFRCISNSWKYQRDVRVDPQSPEPHVWDHDLGNELARVGLHL
jgi:hypothetical protein